MSVLLFFDFFFFFNDTATTEIYTLSLHDALPISRLPSLPCWTKPRATIPIFLLRDGAGKRRLRFHLRPPRRLIRKSRFSTFRLAVRDRLQDSVTAISPTLDSGSLKTCPIRES